VDIWDDYGIQTLDGGGDPTFCSRQVGARTVRCTQCIPASAKI
jgi:hypothetical protein